MKRLILILAVLHAGSASAQVFPTFVGLSKDTADALYLPFTGGTITGPLTVEGTLTLRSGTQNPYDSISAAGPTALNGHHTVECDTTSNDVTLTIPLAASHTGRQYIIGKSVGANNCILARSGADTFAGVMTTYTLEGAQEALILISNGVSTWWILDGVAHGNLSAAAQTHTPAGAGSYEKFVSTDSEADHNITYSAADDELTVLWPGQYTLDLTAGLSGAAGDTLDLCIFAGPDGSEVCLPKCFFPRKMAASGDVGSGASGCDADLAADDRIFLGIKSDDTTAITIDSMNLRAVRTD